MCPVIRRASARAIRYTLLSFKMNKFKLRCFILVCFFFFFCNVSVSIAAYLSVRVKITHQAIVLNAKRKPSKHVKICTRNSHPGTCNGCHSICELFSLFLIRFCVDSATRTDPADGHRMLRYKCFLISSFFPRMFGALDN